MTDEPVRIRLRDLQVSPEPWHANTTTEVDCYDAEGFAAGEPIVLAGTALAKGAQRVQPGDVLLSTSSQGPRRTWVVGETRGRAQIAAADWQVLRGDAVASGYLRHILVSDEFQRCLGAWSGNRRTRSRFSADVAAIEWVVPAMDRQVRVGQMLDHVDALRARRARVLRGATEFTHALFAELFGMNPGDAHAVVPLSDLLVEAPQRGIDVELHARGSFPVLRPVDIREGRLSFADARYVTHSDASLARTVLADADLVLACDPGRNDIRCAIARPGHAVWFLHARLWRLRLDAQRLLPQFLHAWLLSSPGRSALLQAWVADRRAPGDVRLGRLEVPLPPIERQRAFAAGFDAVDRLQGRLHASADRLDELLGTLRNLAFRGEFAFLGSG